MKRIEQVILIVSVLGFSWLGMQAIHELGHMLGALITGGSVIRVILHPLALSRTDVRPNPSPLFVVWAGPVIGSILPLLAWLIARTFKCPHLFLFRFFAGFCLIANGVYIGVGSVNGVADAGDMLRHGSSQWQLILFALLIIPPGFYLWNGLGPKFGIGKANGSVNRPAALISLTLFLLIIAAELAFCK